MAITSRDERLNTVMTAGERTVLRRAFREIKDLMKVKRAVSINQEWGNIIAHTWELLREETEPMEQFYTKDQFGRKTGVGSKVPLAVVRNPDGSTIVVDKDRACLRAFYSASFSFLCKEHIPVPADAQRCLGDAWDIVRELDDPALPFRTAAAAALIVPFGALLPATVVPSKGFVH